jgi:hypothetical protein
MWYAMREALAIVGDEGLEAMWARHLQARRPAGVRNLRRVRQRSRPRAGSCRATPCWLAGRASIVWLLEVGVDATGLPLHAALAFLPPMRDAAQAPIPSPPITTPPPAHAPPPRPPRPTRTCGRACGRWGWSLLWRTTPRGGALRAGFPALLAVMLWL